MRYFCEHRRHSSVCVCVYTFCNAKKWGRALTKGNFNRPYPLPTECEIELKTLTNTTYRGKQMRVWERKDNPMREDSVKTN